MDWLTFAAGGGFVALVATFVGPFLTHRLHLAREDRAKFNEAAAIVRKDATRDLSRPGHWLDSTPDDFDALVRLSPFWRRRACRRAVDEYRRAKKETMGQDAIGGVICTDPPRVIAAATALLRYTRPQ